MRRCGRLLFFVIGCSFRFSFRETGGDEDEEVSLYCGD